MAGRRRSAVGPQLDRRERDDGRTVPGGRTPRLARARRHPERPRPADRDHPPGYERRRSAGAGGEVSEVDGDDLREVPGQRHDPGGHDGAAAEARPGGPDRALQRGARGTGEEARPAAGGLPRRDPRPAAGRGLAGHADQRRRRPSDKPSRCRSGDAREPGEGRLSAPLLAQPAQGDRDQGQGARWGGRRGQDGARPARQGAEASCCAGSRRACHSGRHRLPGDGASPAPARGKRRPRAERCRTPAGRGGPQARTDDPDRPGRLPNAAVARDSKCRQRCDPRRGRRPVESRARFRRQPAHRRGRVHPLQAGPARRSHRAEHQAERDQDQRRLGGGAGHAPQRPQPQRVATPREGAAGSFGGRRQAGLGAGPPHRVLPVRERPAQAGGGRSLRRREPKQLPPQLRGRHGSDEHGRLGRRRQRVPQHSRQDGRRPRRRVHLGGVEKHRRRAKPGHRLRPGHLSRQLVPRQGGRGPRHRLHRPQQLRRPLPGEQSLRLVHERVPISAQHGARSPGATSSPAAGDGAQRGPRGGGQPVQRPGDSHRKPRGPDHVSRQSQSGRDRVFPRPGRR